MGGDERLRRGTHHLQRAGVGVHLISPGCLCVLRRTGRWVPCFEPRPGSCMPFAGAVLAQRRAPRGGGARRMRRARACQRDCCPVQSARCTNSLRRSVTGSAATLAGGPSELARPTRGRCHRGLLTHVFACAGAQQRRKAPMGGGLFRFHPQIHGARWNRVSL